MAATITQSTASPRSTSSAPPHGPQDSSPTSRGGRPRATTPSFFIIQEPQAIIAPGGSPSTSPSRQTPTSPIAPAGGGPRSPASSSPTDLDRQRRALASRQSVGSTTHSLYSGSPGPRRRTQPSPAAGTLHEETEADLEDQTRDNDERKPHGPLTPTPTTTKAPTRQQRSRTLSILNRVGSSPDLPLHNSWSTVVYSSSKKRQLLKPSTGTGASPHLAALRRSRLIPLPVDIRTGTFKRQSREADDDDDDGVDALGLGAATSVAQQRNNALRSLDAEEKMNYELTIGSLKERLSHLERELTRSTKRTHALEKQLDGQSRENHSLHTDKAQLQRKVDELERSALTQRHAFDKLSEKYASVYANLEKISDANAGNPHVAPVQTVIQTLARENQELQRKLRVLEGRHAEDKVVLANQEKKIKRLRAEMEALQHMSDASTGPKRDDLGGGKENPRQRSHNDLHGEETNARSPLPGGSTTGTSTSPAPAVRTPATPGTASTGPSSEELQYVDPNILKVLEKVDSQFSITSAISLSAALKKWFHSCLHVVATTDITGMLHVFLKRACELLHCQHAAIFQVDHLGKRLLGVVSERGQVRWELPLEKGILGHAARHNALCNVRKAYDDPRFFSSSDTITGTKSREVLCIPITRELESHQATSVFAVLQVWNTVHQKPFSSNDQIVGGLLGVQAGTLLLQHQLQENLQRVNRKVLQIVSMQEELVQRCKFANTANATASADDGPPSAVSMVHLVRAAQKKFAEIVGITKLRIYVFDEDVMRLWHVGSRLDATTSTNAQLVPIRKYANAHSTLCAILLQDANNKELVEDAAARPGCRILLDPTAEPTYNDTVDLKGGANGLYIAPIRSPWRDQPLGMIQVARTASALASVPSRDDELVGPMGSAALKEKLLAQKVEDDVTMALIELFCRMLASLLHHAEATQLHERCPAEVQEARLAYLTDRLEWLESEYLREQEEAEAEALAMERHMMSNARLEQKLLETTQRRSVSNGSTSRPQSALTSARNQDTRVLEPVPLISTDSMYAIDVGEMADADGAASGDSNNPLRSLSTDDDTASPPESAEA